MLPVDREVKLEIPKNMRLRWPAFLLSATALFSWCPLDQRRAYELKGTGDFLFERWPQVTECWKPEPAVGTYPTSVTLPKLAPYVVNRAEEMTFAHAELPALTITADPATTVIVSGSNAKDWSLRFCAVAGGQTESDAADLLRKIRLSRLGGIVSVTGPGYKEGRPTRNTLIVYAPADAPVIVNAVYSAIQVYDMSGPVRASTTHGRVKLLGTTGQVDATGMVVDFAGDRGQVRLNADAEINLKITANRFDGTLDASALRPVRLLLPPGFASPIEAVVARKKDFVCRADICSQFKRETKYGLYAFTYRGDATTATNVAIASKGTTASDRPALFLRSEETTVVIDSTDCLPNPWSGWNHRR